MRVDDKEDTKNVSIMILIVQLRSLFYLLLFNDFRAFLLAVFVICFNSRLKYFFFDILFSNALHINRNWIIMMWVVFCVMFCAVVCCLQGVIFNKGWEILKINLIIAFIDFKFICKNILKSTLMWPSLYSKIIVIQFKSDDNNW